MERIWDSREHRRGENAVCTGPRSVASAILDAKRGRVWMEVIKADISPEERSRLLREVCIKICT